MADKVILPLVFMQLYFPNKFLIDKICVMIGEQYFGLVIPKMELNYNEKYTKTIVEESLVDFLQNCYFTIPYRRSKAEIRNIPYIIMNTHRSVEDNFLLFYRFIECYYKKQQIPDIKNTFVSYSIKEHYVSQSGLSDELIEKYAQEMICLRNQCAMWAWAM